MKRILFTVLVIVLAMGIVTAYAGDGCGAKATAKTAKDTKTKACCPGGKMKAGCATKTLSGDKAEGGHKCPDVTERTALMNFHEAMHPMHVAYQESNFDQLREKLPTLMETTKAVGEYKCDGYEKCSDPCRKNFDGKKGDLLESVNSLKEACKGKNNEKVTAAFDVMHEAYISFANTCTHPEDGKEEHHGDHQ